MEGEIKIEEKALIHFDLESNFIPVGKFESIYSLFLFLSTSFLSMYSLNVILRFATVHGWRI